MINRLKILLSLVLVASLFVGCTHKNEVRVIRLGHGLPEGHPVHKAMVFMGEELEKNSKGKMKLQIYPSNQLGGERECLELLQIGSLDISKVSAYVLENFDHRYKAFTLPYVFKDEAHRQKVLDGPVGQDILNGSGHVFLKGLCFYDAGSRSFYTVEKPISTPEDLDGLKIRVMQSHTAIEMVDNMGGNATPIDFGELYSALQQGVVDGAENNPPSFYTSKHYEVCKYYTVNKHASVPDILVLGTKTWESLNAEQQKWLNDAALSSVPFQRKLWADFEKEAIEKLTDAGVEITYPDQKLFAEKVKSMHTSGYLGEELHALFDDIQKEAQN